MTSPFFQKFVEVIDESLPSQSKGPFHPFALGEYCTRQLLNQEDKTILHFWSLPRTVILGMADMKLPYLEEGVKTLYQAGYEPIVRHSGGLAVVNDIGILNISFMFTASKEPISISQAYQFVMELIQQAFPEAVHEKAIKAYEITHSYCPGEYDLSIQGKKFAGISQRRFKHGIAVFIYLSIYGNQEKRGQLIQQFYTQGIRGKDTPTTYPQIEPECMANLSNLLEIPLTEQDVYQRIISTLKQNQCIIHLNDHFTPETVHYEQALETMQNRNQVLQEMKRS